MSKRETELIKLIDEKQMFDAIMPALRELIKNGGDAMSILKKSEPLAAIGLTKAALSGDVKAQTEILNRVSGKPLERSVNIYGDIAKLSERDIDQQIMQLIGKSGAQKMIENTLQIKPITPKITQKRKPRKSEPVALDPDDGPK